MNEKKKFGQEQEVAAIIKQMMRAWGFEDKMKEMDIVEAWPELMGKGVAYRTTDLYVKNKVLHIKLNSSVMREELQYGRSVIIQRVNEFAGCEFINDIWFE